MIYRSAPLFIGLCLILGCMGNKENTVSENTDISRTIPADSVKTPEPDPASLRNNNFQKAYDDIIASVKKSDFALIDQYIDPSKGYYLITRKEGQSFYSYQHGDHFSDLNGTEGPEGEMATAFLNSIREDNSELLTLSNKKDEPDAAKSNPAGTYKIGITKIKPLFSKEYSTNKMGGEKIDKELLQSLTELEGGFTSKVFFNRPSYGKPQGAVLYFSESSGNVYLSAIDLTDFK